jgi:hypothetical protein
MASAHAVDWILLNDGVEGAVRIGDVVSRDAGGMPIYKVLALDGGRAWLRDDRHALVQNLSLEDFRWKAAATS